MLFITSSALWILCISILLTYCIRQLMLKKKIFDYPKDRGSHNLPMPRSGGLSFVIISLILFLIYFHYNKMSNALFYALMSGTIIALIGLADDVASVPAKWRGLVHFCVAIWVVYWLGPLKIIHPLFSSPYLVTLIYIVTIIGIVWCINLFNFMDGIDASASIEGIFLALVSALLFFLQDLHDFSSLFIYIAAAIAGFSFWNWPPAKIFMGDSGSCFLGLIFAVIALYSANNFNLSIYFWLIVGSVYICDTTLTLIFRIYQKKPWYEAHHDHAYQALLNFGLSHKNVTFGILLINLFILSPNAFIALHSDWKFTLAFISILEVSMIWVIFIKLKFVFERENLIISSKL